MVTGCSATAPVPLAELPEVGVRSEREFYVDGPAILPNGFVVRSLSNGRDASTTVQHSEEARRATAAGQRETYAAQAQSFVNRRVCEPAGYGAPIVKQTPVPRVGSDGRWEFTLQCT